jgi:hypothetical protein
MIWAFYFIFWILFYFLGEGCLEKSIGIFQKFFWVKICIFLIFLGFVVVELKICDHGSSFAWEGFFKVDQI